ncbi:squalene/phytoene synthase family protein [Rubellimicrobium roseum]|uniref:Uncharacterized protein n=1 Tax=Rubellimicrobium roseum TaxID=687525 RepID=A0A5C4NHV3_9RHOB|nr:hypothetical protein FHG71_09135 [Rubellimicrobium roseum]
MAQSHAAHRRRRGARSRHRPSSASRREFDPILTGMRMDVDGIVAPHLVRLARCVRGQAGTVGLLSMRVFGARQGEETRRFALSLACAMQLTDILRDEEEDPRAVICKSRRRCSRRPAYLGIRTRPSMRRVAVLAPLPEIVSVVLGPQGAGSPRPGAADDGTPRQTLGEHGGRLVASVDAPPRLAEDDR